MYAQHLHYLTHPWKKERTIMAYKKAESGVMVFYLVKNMMNMECVNLKIVANSAISVCRALPLPPSTHTWIWIYTMQQDQMILECLLHRWKRDRKRRENHVSCFVMEIANMVMHADTATTKEAPKRRSTKTHIWLDRVFCANSRQMRNWRIFQIFLNVWKKGQEQSSLQKVN